MKTLLAALLGGALGLASGFLLWGDGAEGEADSLATAGQAPSDQVAGGAASTPPSKEILAQVPDEAAPQPTQRAEVVPGESRLVEALQERVADLEGEMAQLRHPSLDHPVTGLDYLTRVKIEAVFEKSWPTAEEILSGSSGLKMDDRRTVEAILGEAELARLIPLLQRELARHGHNHDEWRSRDKFAQRLYTGLGIHLRRN